MQLSQSTNLRHSQVESGPVVCGRELHAVGLSDAGAVQPDLQGAADAGADLEVGLGPQLPALPALVCARTQGT